MSNLQSHEVKNVPSLEQSPEENRIKIDVNSNNENKVITLREKVIKLLKAIKKSEKLTDYEHPSRKNINSSYSQDEITKLNNFRTLAGKLRNLYYFFGDNEIDSLLDDILVTLKFDYNTSVSGNHREGVRRTWGLVTPLPGDSITNAKATVIYSPLSLLGKITGKTVDIVRVATTKYETLVDDLKKYVIENKIINDNYMKAGTKRRSRKYRRFQSRRLPNRKIGRRSRKH